MAAPSETTENNDQPDLAKSFNLIKLITDIALLTALISAVGYYIGWTGIAGYYLTFGLSPNFIKKSVPDVLASAWLELFLGLVGIAIAIVVFQALVSWLNEKKFANLRFQRKVLSLFYVSLISSILFLISSVMLIRYFGNLRLSPNITLPLSILLMALALLLFLTASTIGKQFRASKEYLQRYPRSLRFFRWIYPNHQVYFGILGLWIVLLINRAGVWRGSAMALVDQGPYVNLPSVIIYSSKPLPLQGRLEPSTNLYIYDRLRLIDGNDDYLFLLKESSNITSASPATYAVPRTNELILELRP